jgi:hypothetical protein
MATQAFMTNNPSPANLMACRGVPVKIGHWALIYALALVFLWFGALKFTAFEASWG